MVADTTDWGGGTTVGPNNAPLLAAYQLNIGVTQNIIAAAAGLSIVFYGIELNINDNSTTLIAFQDTSGISFLEYNARVQNLYHIPLYGAKLPLGLGLQVRNVGAVNMAQADLITVIYSQA